MVRYQKKAPPHLAPLGPTAQKVRIPTERKKRGINRMVSSAGSGEAHKGKELGKESGEGEVNDNPVGGGEALKGKELRKESGKGEIRIIQWVMEKLSRKRNWVRNQGRVKSGIIRWVAERLSTESNSGRIRGRVKSTKILWVKGIGNGRWSYWVY